jgi:hypothetical protein
MIGSSASGPIKSSAPDVREMTAGGASLASLMRGFISLGMNCEFGLVQQYCGANPTDLFRFGLVHLVDLLALLDRGLVLPADSLNVQPDAEGREYLTFLEGTRIGFHTNQLVENTSEVRTSEQERRRLPRLARKLRDELAAGDRACVYAADCLDALQALRLHDALLRFGPVRLLVVSVQKPPHGPGSVVKLRDGLMFGTIDRLTAPTFARRSSVDVWLALIRTASAMFADPALPPDHLVIPSDSAFDIPDSVANAVLWRALAALRRERFIAAFLLYKQYGSEFDPQENADEVFTAAARTPSGLLAAHRVFCLPNESPRKMDETGIMLRG